MKSISNFFMLSLGIALVLSGSGSEQNSKSPREKRNNVRPYSYFKDDASAFVKLFKKESKTDSDKSKLRELRKAIYKQTMTFVNRGYYHSTETNSKVAIPKHEYKENNTFYDRELPKIMKVDTYNMKVEVNPLDTFLAGKKLLDEDLNPVILNFANAYTSGGGVLNGAGAQEECLFRRSDYFKSLKTTTKNIVGNFEAHYNPKIVVFRAQEAEGYALLEENDVFTVSGIAVAAPMCRKRAQEFLEEGQAGGRLNPNAKTIFEDKIRTILRIAFQNGHNSVVLGALGAGAFGCHPHDVASIFKRILKEEEFHDAFKKIVFAILNDHNGGDLFSVFETELSDLFSEED